MSIISSHIRKIILAACLLVVTITNAQNPQWECKNYPKTPGYYPAKVRIGGIFPLFHHDGTGALYPGGSEYLHAFLMAVRAINDKTDGLWDCLLPHTKIEFAIRYQIYYERPFR